MIKSIFKNYSKIIVLTFLSIISIAVLSQKNFAQSTDPDAPTALTNGVIEGSNMSGLSDEKDYYFAFDVKKGTLNLTLNITPVNKSDAGGFVSWKLMNTKFEVLKSDTFSAQGVPNRQVKEMPVTVRRRIIMKIVVSGNMNYKFKFSVTALN